MKPKSIDKNDPKMIIHDLLFGISKKRDEGRVKLVMSLVNLLRCIENIEDDNGQKDCLKDYFFEVAEEVKLTDRERHLLEFEANNLGI